MEEIHRLTAVDDVLMAMEEAKLLSILTYLPGKSAAMLCHDRCETIWREPARDLVYLRQVKRFVEDYQWESGPDART